jgi:hypothetical protein
MAYSNSRKGFTSPKKNVFVRKTGNFDVYAWSPTPNNFKRKKEGENPVYFCTATANSQGFDFITTYDYNVIVIDGHVKKLAYVACDYVV